MWVIPVGDQGNGMFGNIKKLYEWRKSDIFQEPYKYIILNLPATTRTYRIWLAISELSIDEVKRLYNCKKALTKDEFMLRLKN